MCRRRATSRGGEGDDPLLARVAEALAERFSELALQLSGHGQLLDDVGAADELALDEDLRDSRPAGERRELLAEARIREDVDRGDRRACGAKRAQCALGVAARDEARRSLHEECDGLAFDDLADLVPNGHAVPFVLMRSS